MSCGPASTAPPAPLQTPATVTQQTTITLPAATAGAAPVALTLPAADGFAPSMLFPLPETATTAQVTEAVSSVAFASLPPLAIARLAQSTRRADALPAGAGVLLFVEIVSSQTIVLPAAPSFIIEIPAAGVFADVYYYLALHDPAQPDLGWQYAFEGPAALANATLTFAPDPAPFTFAAGLPYFFVLYAIPQTSVQPTSAPSSVPMTTPSPGPLTTPNSPSLRIGITVPTPAPIVCSPSPIVVTVGQTIAAACSEAGYGGAFQFAFADPAIATITLPTSVPIPSTTPSAMPTSTATAAAPTAAPTAAPPSAAAPPPKVFSFSITGKQAGVTTLSVSALDGGVGTLPITVTTR